MAKRELIYRDEARRAVLKNAPGAAWCINSIKPVMVIDETPTKPTPQIDDMWIARIRYWPERGVETTIVCIYYVWQNGDIDFIPFFDSDVIRSTQCAQFELLERIEMEKYK